MQLKEFMILLLIYVERECIHLLIQSDQTLSVVCFLSLSGNELSSNSSVGKSIECVAVTSKRVQR